METLIKTFDIIAARLNQVENFTLWALSLIIVCIAGLVFLYWELLKRIRELEK